MRSILAVCVAASTVARALTDLTWCVAGSTPGNVTRAVAAGDVDGDVAHFALAVAVDVQPAGQRDVEAAQQRRIGRQVGQHRGLQAVDIGLDARTRLRSRA